MAELLKPKYTGSLPRELNSDTELFLIFLSDMFRKPGTILAVYVDDTAIFSS